MDLAAHYRSRSDKLAFMKPAYHPEIEGLRAIAVAGVLLCHFKAPGFSGGFAGVDVFFVISGYLITGMILRDIKSRSFSFPSFYVRRTRRIFPALTVTLSASLLAATIFFLPDILKAFAVSLVVARYSVSGRSHGYSRQKGQILWSRALTWRRHSAPCGLAGYWPLSTP